MKICGLECCCNFGFWIREFKVGMYLWSVEMIVVIMNVEGVEWFEMNIF